MANITGHCRPRHLSLSHFTDSSCSAERPLFALEVYYGIVVDINVGRTMHDTGSDRA